MTLPQNVKDAFNQAFAWTGGEPTFRHLETIRAHLMSQEAEVKRLNAWIAEYCKANRKAFLADQYRLAAANALLREIGKMADGTLCDEVRDYLQGAGDEA